VNAVTVEAVEVTHGRRAVGRPILTGVSFAASAGQLVVLEGRSGSGKSTLCQLVAGLEPPDQGQLLVGGRPASEVQDWARLALLPQRLGLSEELTVTENVQLPCWVRGRAADAGLLADLDVERLAERRTGELSRGEQQRVALARAAVLVPDVLVLDEPTSHQDEAHADLVVARIRALAGAGSTVVVATHDPQLVAVADQVVHLRAGDRVG
jgi:putative ABC transport system ATP-binding protein